MGSVLRTLLVWITTVILAVVSVVIAKSPRDVLPYAAGVSQGPEAEDVPLVQLPVAQAETEDSASNDDESDPDDDVWTSTSSAKRLAFSWLLVGARVHLASSMPGRERGSPPRPPPEA